MPDQARPKSSPAPFRAALFRSALRLRPLRRPFFCCCCLCLPREESRRFKRVLALVRAIKKDPGAQGGRPPS